MPQAHRRDEARCHSGQCLARPGDGRRGAVEALGEGRIGGAALDVFATQPLPLDHPIFRLRQCHRHSAPGRAYGGEHDAHGNGRGKRGHARHEGRAAASICAIPKLVRTTAGASRHSCGPLRVGNTRVQAIVPQAEPLRLSNSTTFSGFQEKRTVSSIGEVCAGRRWRARSSPLTRSVTIFRHAVVFHVMHPCVARRPLDREQILGADAEGDRVAFSAAMSVPGEGQPVKPASATASPPARRPINRFIGGEPTARATKVFRGLL